MGRGHQQQNIKSKDTAPSLVAVAIEAGKNSQHALKWAADHLLSKTQLFFLLHVRSKINTIPTPTGQHFSISEVDEDVASTFLEQIDLQTKELLLPFQCFRNRRGARDLHLWPAEQEHGIEGTRFSKEMTEGKPIRFVLEATKTSKSIMTSEEIMTSAERNCLREEKGRDFLESMLLEEKERDFLESMSNGIQCRLYTLEEIMKATDNFSEELKIGEGGYGPVFRATLDHNPVAIRVLRSNVTQGMKQFQKEVEVLSCISHPNMVLLFGACPANGCLVYEYIENGSLEDRLFCKDNSPPLSWQLHFKIASEIATGLLSSIRTSLSLSYTVTLSLPTSSLTTTSQARFLMSAWLASSPHPWLILSLHTT